MINKYYLRICQADRPRNLVAQDRKPPLPLRGDLAHLSFALVVWATDWPARSQNNGLSNSFLLTWMSRWLGTPKAARHKSFGPNNTGPIYVTTPTPAYTYIHQRMQLVVSDVNLRRWKPTFYAWFMTHPHLADLVVVERGTSLTNSHTLYSFQQFWCLSVSINTICAVDCMSSTAAMPSSSSAFTIWFTCWFDPGLIKQKKVKLWGSAVPFRTQHMKLRDRLASLESFYYLGRYITTKTCRDISVG